MSWNCAAVFSGCITGCLWDSWRQMQASYLRRWSNNRLTSPTDQLRYFAVCCLQDRCFFTISVKKTLGAERHREWACHPMMLSSSEMDVTLVLHNRRDELIRFTKCECWKNLHQSKKLKGLFFLVGWYLHSVWKYVCSVSCLENICGNYLTKKAHPVCKGLRCNFLHVLGRTPAAAAPHHRGHCGESWFLPLHHPFPPLRVIGSGTETPLPMIKCPITIPFSSHTSSHSKHGWGF